MKQILTIIVISLLIISCGGKTKKKVDYNKKITQDKTEEIIHPGKKLLEKHCFLCHNISTSHDDRIAPPMIAVKAHYIKKGTTKEGFMEEFVDFVKNPTKENAKMRGAVKKFNVMPYQQFDERDIKKIAEYIYDYQIEEPAWFKEHWQERQGKKYINSGKKMAKKEVKKTPTETGLAYALGTKKVLGKNLMGTIQKKGTLEALQFCNEKAYPLTDSMSVKFNAIIKRVSDKPRNQTNQADEKELKIISQYKKLVAEKAEINPITETVNTKTKFYYPIVTNSMCLQCHGKLKEQLKPTILKKIAELYPLDKATGYKENEVRGIWSITFKNK